MPIQLAHPVGLLEQNDYAPVAVATGARIVTLAGQVAVTADGVPTASDFAGQVHSALQNVAIGVRGVGGDVADIVRMTFYAVGWDPAMAPALFEGIARAQASDGYPEPLPPITLIGVQALFTPELLVEIEAMAILD